MPALRLISLVALHLEPIGLHTDRGHASVWKQRHGVNDSYRKMDVEFNDRCGWIKKEAYYGII